MSGAETGAENLKPGPLIQRVRRTRSAPAHSACSLRRCSRSQMHARAKILRTRTRLWLCTPSPQAGPCRFACYTHSHRCRQEVCADAIAARFRQSFASDCTVCQ